MTIIVGAWSPVGMVTVGMIAGRYGARAVAESCFIQQPQTEKEN